MASLSCFLAFFLIRQRSVVWSFVTLEWQTTHRVLIFSSRHSPEKNNQIHQITKKYKLSAKIKFSYLLHCRQVQYDQHAMHYLRQGWIQVFLAWVKVDVNREKVGF